MPAIQHCMAAGSGLCEYTVKSTAASKPRRASVRTMAKSGRLLRVTVLFILERFLESGEFAKGDLGVLSAMGPGFSAEHVFFRC